jgi:glutathione peroxidase
MKNKIFVVVTILMFFFKSNVSAEYKERFFDLKIKSISGEILELKEFNNKAVLMVNTASFCGFTKQYSDLQKLWEKYEDKGLIVLGIPSNSFNQEKNENEDVKEFCEVNFNISFPLTAITDVKGDNAHNIYKWAKLNYGNSAVPKWNFYKILINKEGKIHKTFNSFVNPLSKKITMEIEKIL